jgi:hypothetical protein
VRDLGEGLRAETIAELDEVAVRRSQALGRPVAVAAFSGATEALVIDLDDEEAVPIAFPLQEPSPSLAEEDDAA